MTSISGNGFIDTAITGGSLYDVVNNLDQNVLYKNEDIVMPSNKITIRDLEVLNSTTLAGNTSVINATDVEITDRTLLLGKGNTNTNIALAYDTSTTKKGGLLYNPVDGSMKLFRTNQALAGASVNESDPSYELATVEANKANFKGGQFGGWSVASNPSIELGGDAQQSGVLRLYGTNVANYSTIQTTSSNLHLDCPTNSANGLLLNGYSTMKPVIINGSGCRIGNSSIPPTGGYRLDCDGSLLVNGVAQINNSVNARNSIGLTRTGEASAVNLTAYAASSGLGGVVGLTSLSSRASGLHITNTDDPNKKWFIGRTYSGGSNSAGRFVIGGIDSATDTGMIEVTGSSVRVYTPAIVANLNNNVGVNVVNPSAKMHVGGDARIDGRTIINNDTLQLASLTTAERDALVGVANGALIFNSTTGNIEKYESNTWSALSGGGGGGGSISESSLSPHTIVLKGALSANVNVTCHFYKVGKLVHVSYSFFSGITDSIGTITTVSGQIPVDYRPASGFQGSVFNREMSFIYGVNIDTSGNVTLYNNTAPNFPAGTDVTVFAGFLSWVTA